jgi:hypothetical protein
MNVKLPVPPGGPGLWDAVKYALKQKDREATKRLALLLLIIYGLCCGAVFLGFQLCLALLHTY